MDKAHLFTQVFVWFSSWAGLCIEDKGKKKKSYGFRLIFLQEHCHINIE